MKCNGLELDGDAKSGCKKMTFHLVESPLHLDKVRMVLAFLSVFLHFWWETLMIWTFGWFTFLILTSGAYGWWFYGRIECSYVKKWNWFPWNLTGERRFLLFLMNFDVFATTCKFRLVFLKKIDFMSSGLDSVEVVLISMRLLKHLVFRFVLLLKEKVDSEKTATHVDNMLTMVSVCGERAVSELWSFGHLVFGVFSPVTDTSLTVLSRSRVLYVSERARFD